MSVTCDLGGENKAVWKSLGITPLNTSFPNPFDGTRNVFVFADAPHLLKLARYHFIDKGFVNIDNTHISSLCIKEVINLQHVDLKIAFKLKNDHIYVKNKQNVKITGQLMSNTTSKAITFLGEKGLLTDPNWKATAYMIGLTNDWFQILN